MIRAPAGGVILALVWLACLSSPSVSAAPAIEGPQVLAPAYVASEFRAPAAGSYSLPVLGDAVDGVVLDSDGRERRLFDQFGDDKLVLLSFIYSSCSDANGCPLATGVLYSVLRKMRDQPGLRDRVRIISLSFDPVFDTPDAMALYGAGLAGQGDWRFLTTGSAEALQPILDGYGQSVIRDVDDRGDALPSFSHILRVYLIDANRKIRNIYSVSFLDRDLLIADLETVLLDRDATTVESNHPDTRPVATLSRPGDPRDGYLSGQYQTRSLALQRRHGTPADLLALTERPPLGLPPVPQPEANPVTRAKVALGRKLFFDRRLSLNNTFSCAMCHVPEQGFTSNELATAVGFEGRSVRRNAPTLYNVAYLGRLFHDGREETLEQQVWGPLLAANEMANPSVGAVVGKIHGLSDYQGLFEAAFAGRPVGMETLGMALASYQRTLLAGDSAFDRWYFGGQSDAISEPARRGFALFTGKAGCVGCHPVGEHDALFTDDQLHNTGTGYRESMGITPESHRVVLAPGVVVEVPHAVIDSVGEPPPPDLGRYEITQDPDDRWKYRTPSLRNVALSAPYMHNGSIGSLREVVAFYNAGGVDNPLRDARIHPLGLSETEIDDLVAFLRSLTGGNVDAIVADAFAAPVGDVTRQANE